MQYRNAYLTLILFLVSLVSAGNNYSDQSGHFQGRWDYFGPEGWMKDSHPYIELNYGDSKPDIKDFKTDFSAIGYGEIKLGSRALKENPFRLEDNYVFLNKYARHLKNFDEAEEVGNIKAEMHSFGMGSRDAYGYEFSKVAVFPYHLLQFGWTKFDADTGSFIPLFESDKLNRIEGKYRFGGSAEAGIDVSLYKSVSLIAGYEISVVYPRFLFWKWLGGSLVQGVGMEAVTQFAEEIVDLSPTFGPIMYAALQAGTSYLIYTGMKGKMYWPVNSEAPLTHETLKFGIGFRF